MLSETLGSKAIGTCYSRILRKGFRTHPDLAWHLDPTLGHLWGVSSVVLLMM